MKRILAAFILLLMLIPCALAEDICALEPIAMSAETQAQTLDLYCGPTQGFYRHVQQTLDTGKPFVVFGQYDCWAMAAQGTPNSFGPVGWVEAGAIAALPYEPQLSFEDGFAAMVEETAPMTDNPLAGDPYDGWTASLARGEEVIVLAQLGDYLYVQAEIEDTPVRVFIPASSIL